MASQIKVNFSQEEATSEGRLFEALPTGKYHGFIVKIDDKQVKETDQDGKPNKNAGKPWWNVQIKLNEKAGDYNKRVVFASAMLFDGALYTTAQLLKAAGFGDVLKTGTIPAKEQLIGKEVVVLVQKEQDKFAMKKDPTGGIVYKNNVRGFESPGGVSATKTGSSSLLP